MDELLKQIEKLYNLKIDSFERVTKGFLSENYILITKDKKYFLKKYRFDNEEKITEIHLTKKYFADGGIPVILPIINKENRSFFSFNDNYFTLFPFVSDKELSGEKLSDKATISLGEMLGKIHLLGKDAKLQISSTFKAIDSEKTLQNIELIQSEIDKKESLTTFDELAIKSIETKKRLILEGLNQKKDYILPDNQLIHGDYLDHNVFFNKDDQVSYVFDFEKTGYTPRMYELFRSLMYAFLSDDINEENLRKAKLYLDSYLKIFPAIRDELKNGLRLYYIKSIHSLWIENEHYLKNNFRVDDFLLSDFNRIKYLSENIEKLEIVLF